MTDALEGWRLTAQPHWRPVTDEVALFEAAYAERLPVMIKGPTGCGKTRFVEHMAWRLQRPLVTIACHEDTTAGDLVGRWLLDRDGMHWQDGPLTRAARHGAICYLDEVVEARAETTVVIHPLTDTRRVLPIDRRNELLAAHPDFLLVVSHNPDAMRPLKTATRHRFCTLNFDYPSPEVETAIVMQEAGVDVETASTVVALGVRSRRLAGQGLDSGASTRMLVRAAALIRTGTPPHAACRMAMVDPLSDDVPMREALDAAVAAAF